MRPGIPAWSCRLTYAGLSDRASATWISSRLSNSRTIDISNLIDSARQGNSAVAWATPADDRQVDHSHDEWRLVVGKAGPAKVHPLAPLCDYDDSRMVGHPAWRG